VSPWFNCPAPAPRCKPPASDCWYSESWPRSPVFWRYRIAGAAIRAGKLPPPGHGPALITAGVAAAAAAIITIYLVT